MGCDNRMLPIGANFPSDKSDKRCWCGEVEDSQYIYIRKYWTDKVNKRPICPNYIKFKINYKQRQDYKIKHQSEQEKNEREKTMRSHNVIHCSGLLSKVKEVNININFASTCTLI